jgi:hypothetical protein
MWSIKMATSPYFNHTDNNNEQGLYDDLVIESIKISGFDITYIRRSKFDIDAVLYEPSKSTFSDAFVIEANISENLMGWDGEGNVMSQFGIMVQNNGSVTFSSTRWSEIMKERKNQGLDVLDRPYEGDLIYFGYGHKKFNNTLFQITSVDFSNASWQLGKNFVYRCICTLYSPNHNDKFELPNGVRVDDLSKQVNTIKQNEEIIRQNENTKLISDSIREFSEENPFGEEI